MGALRPRQGPIRACGYATQQGALSPLTTTWYTPLQFRGKRHGMMQPKNDLRAQVLRSMALTSAIGFDLACVLMVCVLRGQRVDTGLHTGPWGLLVGILVGLVGGAASAYQLIRRWYHF